MRKFIERKRLEKVNEFQKTHEHVLFNEFTYGGEAEEKPIV